MADAATSAASSAVEAITNSASPTYSGILPAADCAGIRYTLTFDYPDGNNAATAGTYTLDETYLDADPADANAYKDGRTFKSEGDFTVEAATDATAGKKYIKLVEKPADPTATPRRSISSSTRLSLTLVGADLSSPPPPVSTTPSLSSTDLQARRGAFIYSNSFTPERERHAIAACALPLPFIHFAEDIVTINWQIVANFT